LNTGWFFAYYESMFRSVRKLKLLLASTFAATYLAMNLGGHVFHVHLGCEHFNAEGSSAAGEIDVHGLDFCEAHVLGVCAPNEARSSRDLPGDHREDNSSSSCWTCYMLSQAGDTPCEIVVPASDGYVVSLTTRWSDLYLAARQHVFLARGPPQFLLPQS
jgi:hypothetical protein